LIKTDAAKSSAAWADLAILVSFIKNSVVVGRLGLGRCNDDQSDRCDECNVVYDR
jgi:hypothetical protein